MTTNSNRPSVRPGAQIRRRPTLVRPPTPVIHLPTPARAQPRGPQANGGAATAPAPNTADASGQAQSLRALVAALHERLDLFHEMLVAIHAELRDVARRIDLIERDQRGETIVYEDAPDDANSVAASDPSTTTDDDDTAAHDADAGVAETTDQHADDRADVAPDAVSEDAPVDETAVASE